MSEPTFKLTVTYAAGHDQEHAGLSEEQVESGVGAFLNDLLTLKGHGIRRLEVEIERPLPDDGATYHEVAQGLYERDDPGQEFVR